jgi:thiamine-phosphate pyrophosphorylase
MAISEGEHMSATRGASDDGAKTELLVTLIVGEGAVERLKAVMAAVPVASVVLASPDGREMAAGDVLPLISIGQAGGAAMLIRDDARLARTVKADGVHVSAGDDIAARYEEARAVAGGRAIVGADAGRTRHDAMALGEAGADYVAFGVPGFVKERETAFERQIELIGWWSEIFEIPCVALDCPTPEQAAHLADAGADFVSLEIPTGMTGADAVAVAQSWRDAMAGGGDETEPE